MSQKFYVCDYVRIAKDLGSSMSHFENDQDAVVIDYCAGYKPGGWQDDYGLYLRGKGEVWWYDESQLTLIEGDGKEILKKWTIEYDEIQVESQRGETTGNSDVVSESDEPTS